MSFYIQRDGQPKEFSIEALVDMVKNGSLRSDEFVFDGRMQKWVGATQVAELSDAWQAAKSGGGGSAKGAATPAATPAMAPVGGTDKKRSKKFSETSWFMSAVTYEEGGLTPSELAPMEAGDKFENLPPVPDELRKKFSLSVADIDDKPAGKKK
ncbi:MAG: hypothetical protein FJ100_02460 [Deltaproteobacteria bacterium]|nr:hypothetical protein [Deltaproteobacteria bacterium]